MYTYKRWEIVKKNNIVHTWFFKMSQKMRISNTQSAKIKLRNNNLFSWHGMLDGAK